MTSWSGYETPRSAVWKHEPPRPPDTIEALRADLRALALAVLRGPNAAASELAEQALDQKKERA